MEPPTPTSYRQDPSQTLLVVSSTCRSGVVTSQTQSEFGPWVVYAVTRKAFKRSFGIFNTSTPVYTIDADPQAFALSSASAHDRKMVL